METTCGDAAASDEEAYLLACYRQLVPIRRRDVRRFVAHLVRARHSVKQNTARHPVL
jgi:hypothetical protein